MTCIEYQQIAARFIDGEAETGEQENLFRHLGECSECRSFLESMMRVRDARRKESIPYPRFLDESVLSATVWSRTVSADRPRLHRERGFWSRRFQITAPLASAAVIGMIILGIVTGMLLLRRVGTPAVPAAGQAQPVTVIMLYSMPPVEVHGSRIAQTTNGVQYLQN